MLPGTAWLILVILCNVSSKELPSLSWSRWAWLDPWIPGFNEWLNFLGWRVGHCSGFLPFFSFSTMSLSTSNFPSPCVYLCHQGKCWFCKQGGTFRKTGLEKTEKLPAGNARLSKKGRA